MPLDRQAQAVLERLQAQATAVADLADPAALIAAARVDHDRSAVWLSGPGDDCHEVRDVVVAGPAGDVPARLYVPCPSPTGTILYCHGGGWCMGGRRSYDSVCRALARASAATVASVEYRLAPEHQFPGALEDCQAALDWLRTIAPDPPAVAGDSSGGNLAAALARRCRDRDQPLAFQLLVYPALDASMGSASYTEFGKGPGLTRAQMELCWGAYLGAADRLHPDAAPAAAESLEGLAEALIVTAEIDPLRDDGEQYAARLEAAGVTASVARYDGVPHSFFRWLAVHESSRAAMEQAGAAVARAFR